MLITQSNIYLSTTHSIKAVFFYGSYSLLATEIEITLIAYEQSAGVIDNNENGL